VYTVKLLSSQYHFPYHDILLPSWDIRNQVAKFSETVPKFWCLWTAKDFGEGHPKFVTEFYKSGHHRTNGIVNTSINIKTWCLLYKASVTVTFTREQCSRDQAFIRSFTVFTKLRKYQYRAAGKAVRKFGEKHKGHWLLIKTLFAVFTERWIAAVKGTTGTYDMLTIKVHKVTQSTYTT